MPYEKRVGPEHFADRARAAMVREAWAEAADQWLQAHGATLGHDRRDRYWDAYTYCLDKVKRGAR